MRLYVGFAGVPRYAGVTGSVQKAKVRCPGERCADNAKTVQFIRISIVFYKHKLFFKTEWFVVSLWPALVVKDYHMTGGHEGR